MFNTGKKLGMYFLAGSFVFAFAGAAMAQHGHGGMAGMDMSSHGSMSSQGGMDMSGHGSMATQGSGSHSMSMKDRPVQSVSVDGYKVSLDIMDMSAHMAMPGMKMNSMSAADHSKSHAFMVTIQDTASKEIISDAKISYTLVSPSGEKETGKLDWSGDHYERSFNAKEKGAYQVQLQIESGGMEREAKFSYSM